MKEFTPVSPVKMDELATFIVDITPPHTLLDCNAGFCKLTGYSKQDILDHISSFFRDLVYPDDYSTLVTSFQEQLLISNLTTNRFRLTTKPGQVLTVLCNGQAYTDDNGKEVLQCILSDITLLQEAVMEGEQAKNALSEFAKYVQSGVSRHMLDNSFSVIWANDFFYSLFGYSKEEWDYEHISFLSLIHPKDLVPMLESLSQFATTDHFSHTLRVYHKDSSLHWITMNAAKSPEITDGYPIVNLVISDITALKEAERKAHLEGKKYEIISDISDDISFDYDFAADCIKFSPKFSSHFGYSNLIEHPLEFIQTLSDGSDSIKDDLSEYFHRLQHLDASGEMELQLHVASGELQWFYSAYTTIYDENHVPQKAVGLLRNIHSQKLEQQQLIHQTQCDAMTDLYNKVTTETLVRNLLIELPKESLGAIFVIDIDNFKSINDYNGHSYGDEVIQHVASILRDSATEHDIIGRIGGDEFVLFMSNMNSKAEAEERAAYLLNNTRKLPAQYGYDFPVTLSIGITYTKDFLPYHTLFDQADIALYSSKSAGKDRYTIYKENMQRSTYINDRSESCSCAELLEDVFELLNQTENKGAAFQKTLQYIGTNLPVEVINIYEMSHDEQTVTCTMSWKRESSQAISKLGRVVLQSSFEELHTLCNQNFFYCKDPQALPLNYSNLFSEEASLREFAQHVIEYEGKSIGYITYENHQLCTLTTETIATLKLISSILGEFIREKHIRSLATTMESDTMRFLNSVASAIYIIEKNTHRVTYCNETAQEQFPHLSIGQICYKAINGTDTPCEKCPAARIHNNNTASSTVLNKAFHCELDVSASSVRWSNVPCVLMTSTPHRNTAYEDLAHSLESRLVIQKNTTESYLRDRITGYPNFERFKLEAARILSENPDKRFILYYGEIRRFRQINESYGHETGEALLCHIADVLNQACQENETFARVMNSLFVSLHVYESEEIHKLRYEQVIKNFINFTPIVKTKYNLDYTIGAVLIDSDNHHLDINTLIDYASMAYQSVKQLPGQQLAMYDEKLRERIIEEASYEDHMEEALESGEFLPYLQPKFSVQTNDLVGTEVLVRWNSTANGFLPPNKFIPLFEKNGFITEIDFYMLESICKYIRDYLDNGLPVYPCSVNMSRITLLSDTCVERVKQTIERYHVDPCYIEFEVTENVFIDNSEQIVEVLNELHALGFSISMDDFGSGYSSLRLLKELPIDVLKLDREFLSETSTSSNTYHIMKSIVDMAHMMNIHVICEGVETEEQLKFLQEIGCEQGQGFLYAKPMPLNDYHNLIKESHIGE